MIFTRFFLDASKLDSEGSLDHHFSRHSLWSLKTQVRSSATAEVCGCLAVARAVKRSRTQVLIDEALKNDGGKAFKLQRLYEYCWMARFHERHLCHGSPLLHCNDSH